MATRCIIGTLDLKIDKGQLEDFNSKVKAISCHYDGYPEGVGSYLIKYYNDQKKANKLISMGNLSSLGKPSDAKLSVDERVDKGFSVFYHRDMGYDLSDVMYETYKNPKEYVIDNNERYDYAYLYFGKNVGWMYIEPYGLKAKEYNTSLWKKILPSIEERNADKQTVFKIISKYDQTFIGKLQTQIEDLFN